MSAIGNNFDNSTDYDWSAMFNATPLPIEEDVQPESVKTTSASTPKEVVQTEASSFEFKSTINTNFTTASTSSVFGNAFKQPIVGSSTWQLEAPTLQVNILTETTANLPFLCEKVAVSNLTLDTSTIGNVPLKETGYSFNLGVQNTFNNFTLNGPGFGYSSSFYNSLFPALDFTFMPPPRLSFGFQSTPPKPSEENKTQPIVSSTIEDPSLLDEDTKKIKDRAVQESNFALITSHLKSADIDKSLIEILTKVYNSLSGDKQQAMLNELTTTVFSAQLVKQKIELKAIARHYAQDSIADNIEKGKGAIEDARSVIF